MTNMADNLQSQPDQIHLNQNDNTIFHVPSFLLKLYEIVEKPEFDAIVSWTEGGESF